MAFKVDKLGFDSLTAKSMVYLKYVPEVMQGKQIKRGFRATEFQKHKRVRWFRTTKITDVVTKPSRKQATPIDVRIKNLKIEFVEHIR